MANQLLGREDPKLESQFPFSIHCHKSYSNCDTLSKQTQKHWGRGCSKNQEFSRSLHIFECFCSGRHADFMAFGGATLPARVATLNKFRQESLSSQYHHRLFWYCIWVAPSWKSGFGKLISKAHLSGLFCSSFLFYPILSLHLLVLANMLVSSQKKSKWSKCAKGTLCIQCLATSCARINELTFALEQSEMPPNCLCIESGTLSTQIRD